MTTTELHSKVENISKRLKLSTWLEIATVLSIFTGVLLYFTDNHENGAVNNAEIRAMIKESNSDLTNKIDLHYLQLNDKIDRNDIRDSMRNMTTINVLNTNHTLTNQQIKVLEERVKHLEFQPVIEKRTKLGLITIPYHP